MDVKRGDIFLITLEPVKGSEQGSTRPCLIIQNNISNKYSPTTIVAPTTTKIFTKEYPTNVEIKAKESGLDFNSTILLNQIRTVDKSRIVRKLGELDTLLMKKVNLAIKAALDLD